MWPTLVCLDGIQKESLILLPSKRHLGDVVNLVFCRVKIVENSNTGDTGHMSKLQVTRLHKARISRIYS